MTPILDYVAKNYPSLLKETLWMFLVIIISNAVANASANTPMFGENPVKYFVLVILLSIPAGVGSHFINKRFIKKKA